MNPAIAIATLILNAIEAYRLYRASTGQADPTPEDMEANKLAWKAQVELSKLLANGPSAGGGGG